MEVYSNSKSRIVVKEVSPRDFDWNYELSGIKVGPGKLPSVS